MAVRVSAWRRSTSFCVCRRSVATSEAALKEPEWGEVPHAVKVKRLEQLNALQKRISVELNSQNVGKTVEVLVTTDGFTVQPLEFPGGDIGSLSVHGTVNDRNNFV